MRDKRPNLKKKLTKLCIIIYNYCNKHFFRRYKVMAKKKIPGLGLLKEFKDFITRGNVVDLAVGMIIGAAFTAIVTALVTNIFQPLINSIPIGDGVNGLITMLVGKNADGVVVYNYGWVAGVQEIDLTQSVYINWGAFIMAIINFLLVAAVLFGIIKVINTLKKTGEDAKKLGKYKVLTKDEVKALKKDGKSKAEIKAIDDAKAEEAANAPAEPAAPTTEDLLKEIIELLKDKKAE